jgi:hypothetical protein
MSEHLWRPYLESYLACARSDGPLCWSEAKVAW